MLLKSQRKIYWKCINDQKLRSWCFQINNPIVELQYLNTAFNKYFILMTSSQQVILTENHLNITQKSQTSIININHLDQIITFDTEADQLLKNQMKFNTFLLLNYQNNQKLNEFFTFNLIINWSIIMVQKY
ncbi:unnamed protein product [Paramecium pentaurelia]|uniref:Uncharacterized protein n=1 Tax=Paramecium pentaurelia TaxID=43138 RepID=A0A8S1X989_9CILI|nr:unnamed protein product [Paramecium pentaurelia]